jgi:hypothetical protein
MRLFLLLLILTLTFGCATRNIKYDRNKILKKYSTEYKMFVDNEKLDLEIVFLDKDNIESVQIDKRAKELKITQLKPTKLFKVKNLNLDSLSTGPKDLNKRKINLIVIDGVPLTDSLINNTQIDLNSIKEISILTEVKTKLFRCNGYDGDVLLINTK